MMFTVKISSLQTVTVNSMDFMSPFLVSIHPEYESIEKFVDGSMEADLPMQQISELFNINHFIVSQVQVRTLSVLPYNSSNT